MEWTKAEAHCDEEGNHTCNVPFGPVLVCAGLLVEYVDSHGWDKGKYYFSNATGKIEGVTHFMTLPKPFVT